MLIKICGIKTIDAANTAVLAGVDLIGFVFAQSRRQITPAHATTIAKSLPPSVKKVGVFVNETAEKIIDIAALVGLDFIQLHGDETPTMAKQLPYKIIKAFSIDQVNPQIIKSYPCDYYLIDSPVEEYRGGSGKTFDWQLATNLSLDHNKIILAGGLHAGNVQSAIKLVNPIGVDVSSGVESKGEKDPDKIKAFIESVRNTGKDDPIDNIHNA